MENINQNQASNNESDQATGSLDSQESISSAGSDATPRNSSKPKRRQALIVGGALIAAAATALVAVTMAGPTKLQSAAETCLVDSNIYVSLDDNGKGLYLDGEGEESAGVNIYDQLCVLNELKVPDSVISRMSNTTSLMGQQEGSWEGITALWTYHPSNGLDISLQLD